MSPGDREEVASCLRRHHLVMLLGSSLILCLVATVAVVAVDIGIGLKIVSHQERRQQGLFARIVLMVAAAKMPRSNESTWT